MEAINKTSTTKKRNNEAVVLTVGDIAAKHPFYYKSFMPNCLLNASKNFTEAEHNIFNELGCINFKDNPTGNVLIPISRIVKSKSNQARILKALNIIKSNEMDDIEKELVLESAIDMNTKVIQLTKDDSMKLYGRNTRKTVFLYDSIDHVDDWKELGYNEPVIGIKVSESLRDIFQKKQGAKGEHSRGDVEFLYHCKGAILKNFNWFIRQHQWKEQSFSCYLSDHKKIMQCEGKYDQWRDYRRDVIQKAMKAFKGSWYEFDFIAEAKNSKKINYITFNLAKGPLDEMNIPPGEAHTYENILFNKWGLDKGIIYKLRNELQERVKIEYAVDSKEKFTGFKKIESLDISPDYFNWAICKYGLEMASKYVKRSNFTSQKSYLHDMYKFALSVRNKPHAAESYMKHKKTIEQTNEMGQIELL